MDVEDDDVLQGMDRISQLPQHIFQHILSFLSQKEAVKTCVLSKSRRYLWSTRPNVEFCESDFKRSGEKFTHVVDRTLQGYHDQNLRIQKFFVEVQGSSSLWLLEKWIPKVVCDLGVNTLVLKAYCSTQSAYFDLPSEFFKAQSLQHLYLKHCRWTPRNKKSVDEKLLFMHLRTLRLYSVIVEDRDFEKIMWSCPLIEDVVLFKCDGLRTINFVNNHNFSLKNFEFTSYYDVPHLAEGINIQIYTPSIRTIIIGCCPNWVHRHVHYYSNLKSLHLYSVRVSKESFDGFSSNFPCLEELGLNHCFGFEEFKLSSASIKHMRIEDMAESFTKAAIDAPKIVEFEYVSYGTPASISFATTPNKWKSNVTMLSIVNLDFDASSWFFKISELLTGLSQSEITLDISLLGSGYVPTEEAIPARLVPDIDYTGFYNKPVAVEHLRLNLACLYSASSFPHFINALFRICRPRKMGSHNWYAVYRHWQHSVENNQFTKSLCKILQMGKDECPDDQEIMSCWQQDLQEVILEALDENEEGQDGVWHPVQATNWLEYCDALTPKNQEKEPHKLRFQLKWC